MNAYRRLADHTQWPPSRLIIRFRIKEELKNSPDRRPVAIKDIIPVSDILFCAKYQGILSIRLYNGLGGGYLLGIKPAFF
jgi:hypothetical protein